MRPSQASSPAKRTYLGFLLSALPPPPDGAPGTSSHVLRWAMYAPFGAASQHAAFASASPTYPVRVRQTDSWEERERRGFAGGSAARCSSLRPVEGCRVLQHSRASQCSEWAHRRTTTWRWAELVDWQLGVRRMDGWMGRKSRRS